MTSSVIIRFGGLVAMIGGLAATTLGLLYVLQARGMTHDFIAKALLKGHYEGPVTTMLLVGGLSGIAALHVVQMRHYGRWGALASVAAFAGVAMVVVSNRVAELASDMAFVVDIILLISGVLTATVGVVGLGIVTIIAGVLPRWCGVALIAGSPPGAAIVFLLLSPLMMVGNLPGDIGWALAGLPWIVVGIAVFRAATHLPERPSRVR